MINIDAKIDRVLELDGQATAGPWHVDGEDQFATVREPGDDYCIVARSHTLLHRETGEVDMEGEQHVRNMELIAEYRTLCPALARELIETRAMLAALETLVAESLFSGETSDVAKELMNLKKWREEKQSNTKGNT